MKIALTKIVLAAVLTVPAGLNAFDMDAAMNKASEMTGQSSSSESSKSGSLVGTLMDTLGVTQSQAVGGTAALLNQAKGNMSGDDYSSLLSAVPQLSSLMKSSGGVGSLLGGGASLAEQFASLGMESGMIGKFTPILLEFVQSEGGSEVMNLLKSALLK